eukprot:10603409-Alexandrium_andersonii.AAC.1
MSTALAEPEAVGAATLAMPAPVEVPSASTDHGTMTPTEEVSPPAGRCTSLRAGRELGSVNTLQFVSSKLAVGWSVGGIHPLAHHFGLSMHR